MKKTTFAAILALITFFCFGQYRMAEEKAFPQNAANQKMISIAPQKAGGDVLWEENFDATDWQASVSPFNAETRTGNLLISPDLMPTGWKVYDANGSDFYWHWSQLGPRGRYTSMEAVNPNSPATQELLTSLIPTTDPQRHLASTTAANGVMMLECDYFNTTPQGSMVGAPINMDSYIMTPSIDLSSAAGAHLKWQQRFRWCCSTNNTLSVFISVDYSDANPDAAHWTEFSAKFGTLTNAYQTENPKICMIDLTNLIAGQPNVRFKWQMTGASHYVWMIDDIQIIEPYTHDLKVMNQFADYLAPAPDDDFDRDFPGGYYYIPQNLAGDYTGFRMAVQNIGLSNEIASLNLKIIKNNTIELNNLNSASKLITVGNTDTLKINTPFSLPSEIGKYTFRFEALTQNTDNNILDNIGEVNVRVHPNMYTRTPLTDENMSNVSTGGWVGGDIEGAILASYYKFPVTSEVEAISFYFSPDNDSAKILNGDFYCIGRIFQGTANDIASTTPLASTDMYTLQLSDRGNFVSLPLLDEGNLNLPAGDYYIGIECYTTSMDGASHTDFLIGRDIVSSQYNIWDNGWPTTAILDGDGAWGWVTSNLSIGLQLNTPGGSDFTLSIPYIDAAINDAVEIPVNTSLLTVLDSVISYQFDLAFDPSILSYTGISLAGTISNGGEIVVNNNQSGILHISYMNQTAITGEGALLKLQFNVTGQGVSPLNINNAFMNATLVNNIENGQVVVDNFSPTGSISFSNSSPHVGEQILIMATFSEAMLEANPVKIAFSGAFSMEPQAMTRISENYYTYYLTLPNAQGLVYINLSNGTDLYGNPINPVPSAGAIFEIVALQYGDIDDNNLIMAYDAALTLQYSVGIDPLPYVDPLPWETWRIITADVDDTGILTANDASLILQHSAGLITSFPVETKKYPSVTGNVLATVENGNIVFRSTGELFGLNIFTYENKEFLGNPQIAAQNVLSAININESIYSIGICSAFSLVENTELIKIPVNAEIGTTFTFHLYVNDQVQSIPVTITGINEGLTNKLYTWPNPAGEHIHVEGLLKPSTYQICSLSGIILQSGTVQNQGIDVKKLAPGFYILEIDSQRIRVIKK